MDEEKPFYKNIRYVLPFALIVALAFLFGGMYGKYQTDKEWNKFINSSIQRYNFTFAGYSKFKTQEPLREPFACVLGNGDDMEEIFWNVFTPALNRQPVCFVSTYSNETGGN